MIRKLLLLALILGLLLFGGPWLVALAIVIAIFWLAIAILGWLVNSVRVR